MRAAMPGDTLLSGWSVIAASAAAVSAVVEDAEKHRQVVTALSESTVKPDRELTVARLESTIEAGAKEHEGEKKEAEGEREEAFRCTGRAARPKARSAEARLARSVEGNIPLQGLGDG